MARPAQVNSFPGVRDDNRAEDFPPEGADRATRIVPAPEGTRRVDPPESVPDRVRPETDAATALQRIVDEATDDIRVCEGAILSAQVKKDRALERRANAVNALRAIGITPTLETAG